MLLFLIGPFVYARIALYRRYYSVRTGKIGGTGGRFLSSIARALCGFERNGEELTSESGAASASDPRREDP